MGVGMISVGKAVGTALIVGVTVGASGSGLWHPMAIVADNNAANVNATR